MSEIKIDLNIPDEEREAEIRRSRQLCFKLGNTMPMTEEYSALVNELFGNNIGENSNIDAPLYIHTAKDIKIGKNVTVLNGFKCMSMGGISIGDNVSISFNCTIVTNNHDLKDKNILICKPVIIKNNVWIGANVTILPGVTIGENSVIGAGAVVTKDIPCNCVAVGSPAKVIKNI